MAAQLIRRDRDLLMDALGATRCPQRQHDLEPVVAPLPQHGEAADMLSGAAP